jgi:hypothetical protein
MKNSIIEMNKELEGIMIEFARRDARLASVRRLMAEDTLGRLPRADSRLNKG